MAEDKPPPANEPLNQPPPATEPLNQPPPATEPLNQPPPGTEAPASSTTAPPRPSPAERLAGWASTNLQRPNVRTALAGVALILVGALLVTGSFWTFPILIVGVLMVIVAWVGRRLEGRFAFEWGEFGAGFELRARIKAPTHQLRRADYLGFGVPARERQLVASAVQAPGEPQDALVDAAREWVQDAETIEDEAHTVTVDHLDQLRAVVSAAEFGSDEPID